MKLLEGAVTIIDFETTGLSSSQDRVVEAAALRMEPNSMEWTVYCTLVDPQTVIPIDATAIHGITNEMVKGKPTFDVVARHLVEFAAGSTLVAHNLKFDIGFLNAGLRRHGMPEWRGPSEDSLRVARRAWPGLGKHKLEFLVDYLQIDRDVGGNHRAGADVVFTARMLVKAAAKLGSSAQ